MSEIQARTEAQLAPIIALRLLRMYDQGRDFHTGEPYRNGMMPFDHWLLFWLTQPLTPDNPVDIWIDMTEHEMMEVYGFEDGGEKTEKLALAICKAADVDVPKGWANWDGMGDMPT